MAKLVSDFQRTNRDMSLTLPSPGKKLLVTQKRLMSSPAQEKPPNLTSCSTLATMRIHSPLKLKTFREVAENTGINVENFYYWHSDTCTLGFRMKWLNSFVDNHVDFLKIWITVHHNSHNYPYIHRQVCTFHKTWLTGMCEVKCWDEQTIIQKDAFYSRGEIDRKMSGIIWNVHPFHELCI